MLISVQEKAKKKIDLSFSESDTGWFSVAIHSLPSIFQMFWIRQKMHFSEYVMNPVSVNSIGYLVNHKKENVR